MSVRLVIAPLVVVVLATAGCGAQTAGPRDAKADWIPASQLLPKLASLRQQAGNLLGGGVTAFQKRLDGLHGTPVVVNKWASWCEPCREEFPLLADEANRLSRRVAFIGVNTNDSAAAAKTFLRERPLPYPTYEDDSDERIADLFSVGNFMPATAFYRANGSLATVHYGPYTSRQALAQDVRRYAEG